MNNILFREIITRGKLTRADLQARQRAVFEFMLMNSDSIVTANFQQIASQDLGLLFHITDELFFNGKLGHTCEARSGPLRFRLSKRMTSSGGMTTMTKKKNKRSEFEIAIATTPLFQSFQNFEAIKVGGVDCANRLEALQRIMEHEMIHLAEMLLWDDSNCANRRFKSISSRFFAHSESNHQLLTPRDVAQTKFQIRTGDRVTFRMGGETLSGFVNRITKRATVLVNDRNGTLYDDGQKYTKFYVPISSLRRVA